MIDLLLVFVITEAVFIFALVIFCFKLMLRCDEFGMGVNTLLSRNKVLEEAKTRHWRAINCLAEYTGCNLVHYSAGVKAVKRKKKK